MTNATNKKRQEIKLKLYKNLKALQKLEKHKIVEELLKRNINFTCNSKVKVLVKNLIDMEMHRIQGLPTLFLANLQDTFTMHCHNTSVKYKKEFKLIYLCIIYSKRYKKFFKLQGTFIESMHRADEKPIQPFFNLNTRNMPKLRNFSMNAMNLGAQAKETRK